MYFPLELGPNPAICVASVAFVIEAGRCQILTVLRVANLNYVSTYGSIKRLNDLRNKTGLRERRGI